MPFLDVDGRRHHYQQKGTGPDVVLIHGVTGDLSIWFLCKAIQELSETHRVTAYDLRGHGYSDAPPTGYTSADQAGDLFAIMDELSISSAALVGHSFGGVIAAHAAALAPQRVESVVFSDPYFPALRHLEDVSRWGHWEAFRSEAREAGVELSGEFWYDLGKFFDQVMHLDDAKMLKLRQSVGLPALGRLLRLGATSCGDDSKVEAGLTAAMIAAIDVPTLAVYGEHSPFLSTAEYLSDHLAQCGTAIIPDAKHRAPEENPAAFTRVLKDFFVGAPRAVDVETASV